MIFLIERIVQIVIQLVWPVFIFRLFCSEGGNKSKFPVAMIGKEQIGKGKG